MKRYKPVEILSILRVSSPPHKPNASIENFLATVLTLIQDKHQRSKWDAKRLEIVAFVAEF